MELKTFNIFAQVSGIKYEDVTNSLLMISALINLNHTVN